MEFKQIMIWLIVFIVGSLIVSFLIYPSSFQSFKENVKSITSSISPSFASSSMRLNLKDFNQYPHNYLDKEVKIYAEFVNRACTHSIPCNVFIDKEGYKIDVLSTKHFEFNRWYNVEGIIIYEENFLGHKQYYLKEPS